MIYDRDEHRRRRWITPVKARFGRRKFRATKRRVIIRLLLLTLKARYQTQMKGRIALAFCGRWCDGGIMDLWMREAGIFKYGSGGGKSSGLLSFLKIGDRAANAIKQEEPRGARPKW